MKNLVALFEVDVLKNESSKKFIGVFETRELASAFAIKNKIESSISSAMYKPIEVNKPL